MVHQPIQGIEVQGEWLSIYWEDLPASLFHLMWLRQNSKDALSKDSRSGQRLIELHSIDEHVSITSATHQDGVMQILWSDGCESHYDVHWLLNYGQPREVVPVLWKGQEASHLPVFEWAELVDKESIRFLFLDTLLTYGFARCSGVPVQKNFLTEFIKRFGYIRETNYGLLFDVTAEHKEAHLAYTNLPLSPHSDNNYRLATPSIQILHCLANALEGGESTLVDGFYAAQMLRTQHPRWFDILSSTDVAFEYQDAHTYLYHAKSMIQCDHRGQLQSVHFNERTMAPIPPILSMPAMSASQPPSAPAFQEKDVKTHWSEFYKAYREFSRWIFDPNLCFSYKMQPGDVIVFHNMRLLHGRRAFSKSMGYRHLQGCYADIDAFYSQHRVLRRTVFNREHV